MNTVNQFYNFVKRKIIALLIVGFVVMGFFYYIRDLLIEWADQQIGILGIMIAVSVFVILIAVVYFLVFFLDKKKRKKLVAKPTSEPLEKRYKGLIAFMSLIRDEFLFSWDEACENDGEKFVRFLKDKCAVGWLENNEFDKIISRESIRVTKDKNFVEIIINENKKIATLNISNGKACRIKIKEENGKLNIYLDSIERIKDLINEIEDEFFFSWDKVPGKDSKRFLNFLKDNYAIGGVDGAKIDKTIDSKTIRITKDEKKLAEMTIDDKQEKAILTFNSGEIHDFEIKKESKRIKIFEINKVLNKLYTERGIGQTFRAIKHHCGELEKCWLLYSKDVEDNKDVLDKYIIKVSKKTVDVDFIELTDHTKVECISKIINTIYTEIINEPDLDETDVIADMTGGTAIMSCAMVLSCLDQQRDLEYVEQDTKTLIEIKENVSEIACTNKTI